MSRRSHYRSHKTARSGQHAAAGGQAAPARDLSGPMAGPPAVMPHEQPPRAPDTMAAVPPGDANPAEAHPNGNGPSRSATPNGHEAEHPATRTSQHDAASSGCTAPQLRRFIKSRSWVPMHELRRRFAINGSEDDVTPVSVAGITVYVGLPPREGRLLGELLQAGDIGYELSMDPCTPVVIGVYPMRPVPRH